MEKQQFSGLNFVLGNGATAKIYAAASNSRDLKESSFNQLGPRYKFYTGGQNLTCIEVVEEEGAYSIRLKETVRYVCVVEGSRDSTVSFKNEHNRFLKKYVDGNRTQFQFVNYLGIARIFFGQNKDCQFQFEVVPEKIGYDDDYRFLVESIADKCASLLLEYDSPTSSNSFLSENEKMYDSVLEQFIFLRHFCWTDNLKAIFFAIKRNPDKVLSAEKLIKPVGTDFPTNKFFTNPFSHSANWGMWGNYSKKLPLEVAVNEGYENYDTPANRFVKYALLYFVSICEKVKAKVARNEVAIYKDACALLDDMNLILRDSFFSDIGDLRIMPQNNQVLEKKYGYSQILRAFSLIDRATRFVWSGQNHAYNGEMRNVAVLYEYWLFFELRDLLKNLEGFREKNVKESGKVKPFIDCGKDCLTISLSKKNGCYSSFVNQSLKIVVNLYYNRSFNYAEFKKKPYGSSYSGNFRPDYTLAMFPSEYSSESEALKNGVVNFVHFDAKYRVEHYKTLFNQNIKSHELDDEKIGGVSGNYKREDLFKMHAYNDSIRQTIGSYILYPGDNLDGSCFSNIYDETIPGIGAFPVKPGPHARDGLSLVGDFIQKVAREICKNDSRFYRMKYFNDSVIMDPPEVNAVVKNRSYSPKNYCLVGFMRPEYFNMLRSKNLLEAGQKVLFYYYAINEGYVFPRHKDIGKPKFFRCYTNECRESNGEVLLENWCAKIELTELVSRQSLKESLKALDIDVNLKADYYYKVVLKSLGCVNDGLEVSLDTCSFKGSNDSCYAGNETVSCHSPKVVIDNSLEKFCNKKRKMI